MVVVEVEAVGTVSRYSGQSLTSMVSRASITSDTVCPPPTLTNDVR